MYNVNEALIIFTDILICHIGNFLTATRTPSLLLEVTLENSGKFM